MKQSATKLTETSQNDTNLNLKISFPLMKWRIFLKENEMRNQGMKGN